MSAENWEGSTSPPGNISLPHNMTLLLQLSHEMALRILPVLVVLGSLMVIGTVGNALVVYIFVWRMKATTQNYLFAWLGILDLISCTVGIPSEIADICLYYAYENVVACKIMRFCLTVPPVASVSVLLVIAVDRYRRVCKPLHVQLHMQHAKVGVAIALVIALVFALPALSIYGRRSIDTRIKNVSGFDCSVQDKYQGRLYPLLYEMIFGVAFVSYATALVVMYGRIWCETRRHRQYLARHSFSMAPLSSSPTTGDRDSDLPPDDNLPDEADDDRGRDRSSSQAEVYTRIRRSLRAQKMTVVALAVTLVFILSYLPHLSLIMIRTTIQHFDSGLSTSGLVAYNIFLRSYFVNSVANVFVYSFMNKEFKDHCKVIVKRTFGCFSRSNPAQQSYRT